jgi:hypothetical protein
MEGLRTWQRTEGHDARCDRVPASILSAYLAEGLRPHPLFRLSRQPLPHASVGSMPATAGHLTARRHGTLRRDRNLALSSLRRTNGSTTSVHGSGDSSVVSYPRLFLAPLNIWAHTACSAHAGALVWLHATFTRRTSVVNVNVEPVQLQKYAVYSSACVLSPKTQSAFQRAVSVLSP